MSNDKEHHIFTSYSHLHIRMLSTNTKYKKETVRIVLHQSLAYCMPKVGSGL